ncbi:L-lactate dehydrogenase [Promicromonospora thailandica]|uniref:L-lactate dehydrogenase n=1 Tax=Promicromonospora thailandica TaxID=765201 RepID=A0A9X2G8L8_9MICO|nr:L-lactate dehydrogenase [Promicromonospora thailandica]MCP2263916.1 L-lactate dehydrogenase [Promicromonospora thailandica]BFF17770.1 L-lactate dehydrogenase [Promicromonospora thailandica]
MAAPSDVPAGRPAARTTKIAIVGAGAVGSTLAFAALTRGSARTIALHDVNSAKVEAEVLDLRHGLMFTSQAHVIGSDDVAVCADADVVVVTAGAKQKPGQTRLDLAEGTIGLMRQILPGLVEVAPDATYLMVTNPVDVVTYAALQISGLPRERLFGSGTVLDSSRLRAVLAERCGVAVANVHAYIAGEHGDSEIALWSSASIGGVPLLDWEPLAGYPPIDAEVRAQVHREVVDSAYRIIAGKGATNYAVGLAATRIIEAVLKDEGRVMPVSSLLDGYHGIGDVCLSVPSLVDRRGVTSSVPVPMSDDELAGLRASADSVRGVLRRFRF